MNIRQTFFLLIALAWLFGCQTAFAASTRVTGSNVPGGYQMNYSIEMGGAPFPGKISCGTTECIIGPFIRTGLGWWGLELCDSGGWCKITDVENPNLKMMKVPNYISWQEAFTQYIKRYGASANYRVDYTNDSKKIRWDMMCTGFAVMKIINSVSQLAPNSPCAPLTRPALNCSLKLDNDNIHLGNLFAHRQINVAARAHGVITCNQKADAKIALISTVKLADRIQVTLKANGHVLSSVATHIGQANNQLDVNFDIEAAGIFDHAGPTGTVAVLAIGYY